MIFAPLLLVVMVILAVSAAGRLFGPAPRAIGGPPRRRLEPATAPAGGGRLPPAVQVEVDRIRRKARLLLRHRDRFPAGSEDLYVLDRIERDYLPTTIETYMAVSGNGLNPPLPPAAIGGRTAPQVLHDQLQLLETKLDDIADALRLSDGDRLLANERFLRERLTNVTMRS